MFNIAPAVFNSTVFVLLVQDFYVRLVFTHIIYYPTPEDNILNVIIVRGAIESIVGL